MDDTALLRFSRQVLLPEFGVAGQDRLSACCVVIIGLGGLGSAAAMYLAAAGVGKLVLLDDDVVDLSNLQRQIAHDTDRIGSSKVFSARDRLLALNPACDVVAQPVRFAAHQADSWLADADLVLDCCDNFASRFALNQTCFAARIPLVSGAALGWSGQVCVFLYQPGQACYRCLFADHAEPAATCSERGIMAPLVGVIGSLQALEALKVLAQVGDSLSCRLLLFDGLRQLWRTVQLQPDPACPVCSQSGSV